MPPLALAPRVGLPRRSPIMGFRAAFTLVELLLVVAIVAILAASLSGGRTRGPGDRSRVSRAKADMRSPATALDSYFLDHRALPPSQPVPAPGAERAAGSLGSAGGLPPALTTPVAYLASFLPDPFSPTKGESLRYHARGDEFLLFSAGPDRRFDIPDPNFALEADGVPGPGGPESEPRRRRELELARVRLVPFTYDPTNGATSAGDVWRHGVSSPAPAAAARPGAVRPSPESPATPPPAP